MIFGSEPPISKQATRPTVARPGISSPCAAYRRVPSTTGEGFIAPFPNSKLQIFFPVFT